MKLLIYAISALLLASCNNTSANKQDISNGNLTALNYVYKCEETATKIANSLAIIDNRTLDTTIFARYTKPAQSNEVEVMEQFDWKSWKNNSCKTVTVVIMQNTVSGECNYDNSGAWMDCL